MSFDLKEGFYIKSEKLADETFMSTLYDEYGKYPDKGDRRVYTKVNFERCGKIGGKYSRKQKRRSKQNTRKISASS
jgi:hypothetical protein